MISLVGRFREAGLFRRRPERGVSRQAWRHAARGVAFLAFLGVAGVAQAQSIVLSETAITLNETNKNANHPTRDTYTVKLGGSQPPTGPVTVAVTVSGIVNYYMQIENAANRNPVKRLFFDRSNWQTEQTLTVVSLQQNDAKDAPTVLTHTASGGGYDSVSATLTVTVMDTQNKIFSFTSSIAEIDESTAGSGAPADYNPHLTLRRYNDNTAQDAVTGYFRCPSKGENGRKGIADAGPINESQRRQKLCQYINPGRTGHDFNLRGITQFNLPANQESVTKTDIHIEAVDDNFWEGTETIEISLEGVLTKAPVRIKIIDKDEKPSMRLTLVDGGINEGDGEKAFTIKGLLEEGGSVLDEELVVKLDVGHGSEFVTPNNLRFTPPPEDWKLTFKPSSRDAKLRVTAIAPNDDIGEPQRSVEIKGTAEKFGKKLDVTSAYYRIWPSDLWEWKFWIVGEDRTVRSGKEHTFTIKAQVWQKRTENRTFPKEGLKLVLTPCKAKPNSIVLQCGGGPLDGWAPNPPKLEFTWNEDEKGQPCHSNSSGEGCVKELSWTVTSPMLDELQKVTFGTGGGLKEGTRTLKEYEQQHQKAREIERTIQFTAGGELKVTKDLYLDTTASSARAKNRYWRQGNKISFTVDLNQEVKLSPGTELRITLDSNPVFAPCKIANDPLKVVCTYTVQAGEYDYDGKFKIAAGALDFRGATLTAADDPETTWPAPRVPAAEVELGEGTGAGTLAGTQIYGGKHAFQTTATVQEGFREGAGEQILKVIITDVAEIPANRDITIPITIENGTTTDQDWKLVQGGDVIIKKNKISGEGTAKISAILDAINDEGDETLVVGGSGQVVKPATLTLQDSPPIKLSASPDRIREPLPGTDDVDAPWVDVTLKAEIDPAARVFESDKRVVMLLRCGDRPEHRPCASSGSDYRLFRDNSLATALLIDIKAGQRSGEIVRRFKVLADNLIEGDEVLRLEGRGPFLNVGDAFITIEDASGSMPDVILSASPTTVREGGGAQNVNVTASLKGTSVLAEAVIVTLDVSGEAATEKSEVVEGTTTITTEKDYDPAWTPTSKQITIPAGDTQGSTTVTLGVTPVDDTEVEGDESITVEAVAELQNTTKDPLAVQPVDVILQDNETRGVTVEPTALSIEGGLSKTYRVKLNSKPAHQVGEKVRIDAEKMPGDALLAVTPGALDFTEKDWDSFQTFTVTAHKRAEAATVSIANDVGGGDYRLVTADPVAVTLIEAPEVTLALDKDSIAEDGGVATVTASLSKVSQVAVTVEVQTAVDPPGVATDVTLSNNKNLVIAAGETTSTGTVTITAVNNAVDAEDKTVTVSGAVIGHAGIRAPLSQTLTIPDDDDPPSLTVAADPPAAVNEGAAATFKVARSKASGNAFTVEWTTEANTADEATSAGAADYTAVTTAQTITFAAGETQKTITVQTTDDMLDEPNLETFVVRLANPTGRATIATGTAIGTIMDNDDTPSFTVKGGSATEGEPITFMVTRGGAVDNVVSVQWETAEHTGQNVIAAAETDYTAVSPAQTIGFAKGETTRTVLVQTTEDTIDEPDETFQVVLSGPANAADDPGGTPTLADEDKTAIGTITDDDDTPKVSLTLTPPEIGESGEMSAVTATLNGTSSEEVVLTVSATPEEGAAAGDYTLSANKMLTIAAGETASTGTVTVTAVDNEVDAPDKEVTVSATVSGGLELTAPASQTLTITDDDTHGVKVSPTVLKLEEVDNGDTDGTEENEGTYTVVLDSRPTAAVTVSVTSGEPGVATAAPASLTFAPGVWNVAQTVTVTAVDDAIDNTNDKRTTEVTHMVTSSDSQYQGEEADKVLVAVDDDDGPPTGITLTANPDSLDEDAGATTVTVTAAVSGGTAYADDKAVVVSVVDDTAVSPADYAAVTNFTITIAAGSTSETGSFTLAPVVDNLDEKNETINVSGSLSGVTVDGTKITINDDDATPSFKVEDRSAAEGDAVTFVVMREGAENNVVSVQWKTAASSGAGAASSTDYTAMPTAQTINFAKAVTEQTITVPTTEDTIDEPDETFQVVLSDAAKADGDPGGTPTLADEDKTAIGTIVDDDSAPDGIALTVDTESLSEGAGATTVTVTATVDGTTQYADDKAVVVSVVDDAAVSPADYAAVANFTITIAAETTNKTGTFTLAPVDDKLDENNETINVSGSLSGVTVDGTKITINDNDDPPSFSVADGSAAEGAAVAFVVTRGGAVENVVSVQWTTAAHSGDGVNAAGATDYTAVSTARTINFAQGETTQTITVDTTEDDLDEPDETFQVVLSAPAKASGDPGGDPTLADEDKTAIGTITNDDDRPSFAVADSSATEGDKVAFVVTRTGAVENVVSVQWKTAVSSGASAAASTDYTAVSTAGTISFGKSVTTQTVEVQTTGDTIDEGDETFEVVLSDPAKADGDPGRVPLLGDSTAIGTIVDDDDAPKGIILTVGQDSLSEGAGTVTVAVTATVDGTTQYADDKAVEVSVMDDTAVSPTDYAAVADFTITIAAGAASKTETFTLAPVDDKLDEDNEKINVTGSSGSLTVDGTEITINDNDDPPSFSVADGSAAEGAAVAFVVTRGGAVENVVSVQWTTAAHSGDGVNAAGATDYTAVSTARTINFAQGETTQTITVDTTEDDLDEPDETFQVVLSAPAKASGDPGGDPTLADEDKTAIGTITNDDDRPSFAVADSSATEGDKVAFVVTRTGAVENVVWVQWTTAASSGASAAASTDYTAVSTAGTIRFGKRVTTQTVEVQTTEDTIDEGDETFEVVLSDPAKADGDPGRVPLLGDSTAIGTIVDDDDAPTGITLTVDEDSLDEDAGATTVTVTAAVNGSTRYADEKAVVVSVGGGTAISGTDYAAVSAFTITIGAGEASYTGTFTLTPVNDSLDEENETINVTGALGELMVDGTTLTITDDDTRGITVSETTLRLEEKDSASTQNMTENEGTYTVVLESEPTGTVTVSVSSEAESVATVSPSSLVFTGSTWNVKQTVTVTAVDDEIDNTDNKRTTAVTHTVSAAGTDYVDEAASSVSVEVRDDEVTPTVSLSLMPSTITESGEKNTSTVTASLSGASSRAVTVSVSAAAGSDTASGDYTLSATPTLTIAAGTTTSTGTVTITAVPNDVDAANKSVTVSGVASGGGVSNPDSVTLTITDDDDRGITVSAESLTLDEVDNGSTETKENEGTYTVVLTSEPTGTVTVSVASEAESVATVSPSSLVFTGSTWNVKQTVTVTAVDDEIDNTDNKRTTAVTHTVSAAGTDYVDEAASSVSVEVRDDEVTPTVSLSLTPSTITESGETSTVTASLSGASSRAVTVTVSAAAVLPAVSGDYTLSATPTLTIAAGTTTSTGTVTITAVPNDVDAANKSVTVSGVASGGGVSNPDSVTLTITDDDTRGITVSETALTLKEVDTSGTPEVENAGTYTMVLTSEPTGTVTVSVSSEAESVATVSPSSLVFTGSTWNVKQTVTVTAVDDAIDNTDDKRTTAVTHTVSAAGTDYSTEMASSVSVEVRDDEVTPTVSLSLTPSTITESGATNKSTVTASLSGASSRAVTVTVSAAPGSDTASGDYTLSETPTLTIAAGMTASTGTVTITAVNNDVDAANKSVTVSGVASGGEVSNPDSVTLTITDDDTRGITVSETTLRLEEKDSASTQNMTENEGTYTVVLESEPTGTVTVSVSSEAESVATVSPSSLVFTGSTWNVKQTVTVTAVDDEIDNTDNKRTTAVTHTVSAAGTDYVDEAASSVSVEVRDDEVTPTVSLSLMPSTITESGEKNTSTVTASLSGASSRAVTVSVSAAAGSDTASGDYTLSATPTLTIAAGTTTSTGTVTITAVPNDVDAANKSVTVSGVASGGGVSNPDSVTLTITDDDDRGITVSAESLTLDEVDNGSTETKENEGTYTVVLTSEPTGTVTVSVASEAESVATVSPSSLVFTGSTWNVKQTVTVTAVDDEIDNTDNKRTTAVTHTVSAAGTDYSTEMASSVSVEVRDDEVTPTVSLSLMPSTITESGATNKSTVTASLSGASSRAVTVTVSAAPGSDTASGDYTLSETPTLTIAAGMTASTGTVTITAVNNDVDAANKSVTVSGVASGGEVSNPDSVTLTITDDDTRGITVSAEGLRLDEKDNDGTQNMTENEGTYTVVLESEPTGTVTVSVSSEAESVATVSPSSLVFTGSTWNVKQTVTVTAVDDEIDNTDNKRTTAVTHTVSAAGTDYVDEAASSVSVEVRDDEVTPTVSLSLMPSTITESGEKNTSTVTASLSGASSRAVTVSVSAAAGSDTASGDYTLSATPTLTIAAGTTTSTGTVTITAVPNDVDAANKSVTVSGVASGGGVSNPDSVTLTITDDDDRGITVSAESLTLDEVDNGSTETKENEGTYTVVLTSEPTGTVTVSVASEAESVATVSPSSLVFTGSTWNVKQTVTVTAVDDEIDNTDNKRTTAVTHTVSAAGTDYSTEMASSVSVEVRDDEVTPTVSLSLMPSTITESGATNKSTVTASLSGASSRAVTVTVSAAPKEAGTVAGDYTLSANTTLTIAAGTTTSTGTVTITAVDNDVDADNKEVQVSGAASGGEVSNPEAVTLTIADDEGVPTLSLVLTPSTITESGETSTVTASLSGASSRAVTVTVSAAAVLPAVSGDYTLSATPTLTIAAGTTTSTGTVTITAVPNDVDAANKSVTVSGVASGGGVSNPDSVTLTITDDDTRGITVSETALTLKEVDTSGTPEVENAGTYTMVLTSEPTGTVTVSVSSEAESVATVSPSSLVFTGSTWNVKQTVTVTAVDDEIDNTDNKRTTAVTHTVSAAGTDYSTEMASSVSVEVRDDEVTPTVSLSLTPSTITESGATNKSTVTASLSGASSRAVTVTVSAAPGSDTASGDYTLSETPTLTIAAGMTASTGTVTITAVNNDVDAANKSVTVSGVASGGEVSNPDSVTLTITDDDTRGITVSETTLRLEEKDSASTQNMTENEGTYTVVLESEPTGTVTVSVSSEAESVATVSPSSLVFTGSTWNVKQTVTVTAVDDEIDNTDNKRTTAVTHTVSAAGTDYVDEAASSVSVEVRDDEVTPTVSLSLMPSTITESGEKNTSTVTASLSGASSRAVTVSVSAAAGSDTASGDYTLSATPTLTIAAGTTTSTGTVTITAVPNDVDAANKSVTVSGVASGGGVSNPDSVTLTITDDDDRGITVSAESLTLDEVDNGSTETKENEGTYTVVLTSEPTGTVTVSVASEAESVATVSPSSLVFTGSTWNVKQTVTVTAVDDEIDNTDNKRTTAVTHTVSAAGTDYSTEMASSVSVEVRDDEVTPTVSLSLTPSTITESGATNTSTVTASLSGASSRAVTVTVSAAPKEAGTVAGDYTLSANTTLTIAARTTTSTGTVTITAVDNDVDADNKSVQVSGAASGGEVSNPEAVTLTIADDEGVPTLSLVLTPSEIAESGAASTVTARLSGKSSVAVAVEVSAAAVSPAVSGDYTLSANTMLTIAAGETASAGTVTITAVDNDVDAANKSVTVSGVASGGEVPNPGNATLTITDDDERAIAVSSTTLTVAEADNAGTSGTTENEGTYTVVLESEPTGTVTVSVASGAEGVATVSPSSLEFDADDWATKQTVTVTAVADAVDNTNDKRTTSITHTVSASGTDYEDETASSVSIEVTDDDTRSITVSAATLRMDEKDDANTQNAAENEATYTVVLTSEPTGTVTVGVSSGATTVATVSPSSLVFDADDWDTKQTVTVTAVDDAIDNTMNKRTTSITHTVSAADTDYEDESASSVSIEVTDDDKAPTELNVVVDTQVDGLPDKVNEYAGDTPVAVTVSVSGETRFESAQTIMVSVGKADDAAVEGPSGDYATVADFTITLMPGAASAAGSFTLTPIDDDLDEEDEALSVEATLSGTTIINAEIKIVDNDTHGVTVDPVKLELRETDNTRTSGTTENEATYTVVLTSEPTGTVTVAVSSGAEGVATVSPSSLVFDADDWETKQTVTVTAVDDAIDNTMNKRTVDVTHAVTSSDSQYEGEEAAKVAVTVMDDDATPTVSLSLTPSTIDESEATSTVTASLSGASSRAVTVTVSAAPGPNTAAGDYTLSTNTALTIAAGETASTGTVTITAVDNDVDAANKSVTVSGVASGGEVPNPGNATLTITDDDERAIAVSSTSLTLDEQDDGSTPGTTENEGTYTVVLESEPTGTVTVGVSSGATAVATVSPSSLTFDADDWETEQTVTVTGIDDAIDNTMNKRTTSITHTVSASGTDYQGEAAASVSVTVTDDDVTPGGITLSASPASVGEEDSATTVTVTATVNGSTRYAAATEVVVSVADGTAVSPADYAAVSDFTITIGAGAASHTGTFTLTPVNDSLDEENETVNVAGSSGALTVSGTAVTITDNDATPTVSLSLTPSTVTESEGTSTVTASLDGASSWAVTVTVSAAPGADTASGDYTLSANTVLTIAAGETASTGTVTITAADNDVDAANKSVTVSGVISGGGDRISNPGNATLTITDDDERAIAVSSTTLTVAEADNAGTSGTTENEGTYTVVLESEPTGTVTVGVSSGATTVATVSPSSLTFDADDWETEQTVTVTGIDDAIDNTMNKRTTSITHTVSASGTDYQGEAAASVSVTVTDDDVTPGGITLSASPASVGEEDSATTVTVTATVNGSTAVDNHRERGDEHGDGIAGRGVELGGDGNGVGRSGGGHGVRRLHAEREHGADDCGGGDGEHGDGDDHGGGQRRGRGEQERDGIGGNFGRWRPDLESGERDADDHGRR